MDTAKSRLALSILDITGFLGVIIVNGLAVTLPLNNRTTGELSDRYPNLFVPAGITFSIWGLIYALLAVFTFYSVVIASKKDVRGAFIDRIGVLFFLSCVANVGWIFAWHYEIVPVSVVIMLLLLGFLMAIYLNLGVGKRGTSKQEQYLVHLPFSVYLGWISVATIANVTALLVDIHWDRFGLSEQFWTAAVIIAAIAITLAVLIRRQDIYFGLVVDWALAGIVIKRLASPVAAQSVFITAIIGIGVITVGIIIQIVRKKVCSVASA